MTVTQTLTAPSVAASTRPLLAQNQTQPQSQPQSPSAPAALLTLSSAALKSLGHDGTNIPWGSAPSK